MEFTLSNSRCLASSHLPSWPDNWPPAGHRVWGWGESLNRTSLYMFFFRLILVSTISNDLDPFYERYIGDFESAYKDLGIPVTPKIHMGLEHTQEEIEKYGIGLAVFNESAAESIHADFERHYQGYIVKDVTASSYNARLLKAVKSYNANHV
jgi:hypothetical protein